MDATDAAHRAVHKVAESYAPHQHVPLSGYATVLTGFALGFGAIAVTLPRGRMPVRLLDVPMLGIATHKLSRILAKDFVTAPLRASFTRRKGTEGAGEVDDEPRPHQGKVGHALGDLLSCPYCLGPWVATGLTVLLVMKPLPARFLLVTLNAVAVSDFLHLAYARLNESRKQAQTRRKQTSQSSEPPSGTVHDGH